MRMLYAPQDFGGSQTTKEVNMTQTYPPEWFMEMARLIKARDHANSMVTRWQQKAADAEGAITALSNGTQQPAAASEQE